MPHVTIIKRPIQHCRQGITSKKHHMHVHHLPPHTQLYNNIAAAPRLPISSPPSHHSVVMISPFPFVPLFLLLHREKQERLQGDSNLANQGRCIPEAAVCQNSNLPALDCSCFRAQRLIAGCQGCEDRPCTNCSRPFKCSKDVPGSPAATAAAAAAALP